MDVLVVPKTNMQIIKVRWFGGVDTIGVVLVEDMILNYVKAYIGTGFGNSERSDAIHIAQWGGIIPKEMAESLFGPLPEWRN